VPGLMCVPFEDVSLVKHLDHQAMSCDGLDALLLEGFVGVD
jgi:hypothetical protein